MHTVSQFLSPALNSRLLMLLQLTEQVRSCLPVEVASHCWVANISGQSLVLATDSSAFATPIRYRQQDIINCLKDHRIGEMPLNRVKIKLVSIPEDDKNPPKPLEISAATAAQLRSAASGMTDEGIKNALLRLARRGTE